MPAFHIDPTELWAAIRRLADENDHSWRFTKKGDKRPAYDVETAKQAKRTKLAAKKAESIERTLARQRAQRDAAKPKPGEDIASRMLRAMEPSKWYGQGDLMRLAGADRNERSKVHQVLVKRGWVERARNPAWSGVRYSPGEIMGGAEPEPLNLYRLTEAGLKRQAGLTRG